MLMKKLIRNLCLMSLSVLLSACGASPKTNFYVLNSDHAGALETTETISVGIWQVKLPTLIDRPEMVTRTGTYTIELADFHRWAGGLSNNVDLLIAEELSYNLNTAQIDISPWSAYRKLDFQVKVHIREFDGVLGEQSSLNGSYVVLNGKGNKKLSEDVFMFSESVKGKAYADMASAMSSLVVKLSAKISSSILQQSDKHKTK